MCVLFTKPDSQGEEGMLLEAIETGFVAAAIVAAYRAFQSYELQ